MSKNLLICPKCKLDLQKFNNTYKCSNNHSFDLASSGYANLILANKKRSNNSGDNKIQVNARKEFLNKGHYNFLLEEIVKELKDFNNINILDIGCGEGYYTNKLKQHNSTFNIYGLDISKEAIKKASKLNNQINWLVASSSNIPIKDSAIDVIIQNFAPHNIDEYKRVLKEHGFLITITPAKKHLYQLKQLMYKDVYLNDEKVIEDNRLELVKENIITKELNINSNEDIENLLKMTPYYYKTNVNNINNVLKLNNLNTAASFVVRIYKIKSK